MKRILFAVPALLTVTGFVHGGTPYLLPQLAYGGGWSTTVYLSNTGSSAGTSVLTFYDDSGNLLSAPVNGGLPVSTLNPALGPGASVSFDFLSTGPLRQGWISLDLAAEVNAYAVFKQSVSGSQDQEAVVPLAAPGATSASFPFDNRSLVTTAAVVNASSASAMVNIVVRNAAAATIGTAQITLQPRSKTAFVLADLPGLGLAATANGTVDFVTASPATVAVLGLRFRSQAFTSIPAYHGPISTSLPPTLIPAPVLQGSPLTATSVRLNWTSTAVNRVRFRVEWRGPGGVFTEVAQPLAAATSVDLQGLSASSTHVFRMRVETSSGLSAYSNEVQVSTTAVTAIPAPTGLRLVSANQVEATLAWANNAPSATGIRVEIRSPGTTGFVDIGLATAFSSSPIMGLEAQQAYTFRVRAQSPDGYSAYSNELGVTTPPKITVFLLHGINQDSSGMAALEGTLNGALAKGRFTMNRAFSFAECSKECKPGCSISMGAQKLAAQVKASPPGVIVFVGYSMGGLIARDLIANNWEGALNGRTVAALVTLGSPHLGYPYASMADPFFGPCGALSEQMSGDFRAQPGSIMLSNYLSALTQTWATRGFPGNNSQWLAAAGQSCGDPVRSLTTPKGCSDSQPRNDRVVCSQSATYWVATPPATAPTALWSDPERRYVHTQAGSYSLLFGGYATNLFCDYSGDPIFDLPLNSPPGGGLLVTRIKEVLDALP